MLEKTTVASLLGDAEDVDTFSESERTQLGSIALITMVVSPGIAALPGRVVGGGMARMSGLRPFWCVASHILTCRPM